MIDPLRQHAEREWPFVAEDWTIAGASSESILLALSAVAERGDVIAVEQPTTPRLLQIMSLLDISGIGVDWDREGPVISSLEHALVQKPAAFIFQPRAHLPLGVSMSERRAMQLANILKQHPAVAVIEDDPLGPICATPAHSVGKWIPQQTVLVRSYCKAFGLDLRSSLIGGGAAHVAAIRQKRSFGLGMGSRILQGALLHLLSDPRSRASMEEARAEYRSRRNRLVGALRLCGLNVVQPEDGLAVWLPVADELRIVSALASTNLLVGQGSQYFLAKGAPHIAIHVGNLRGPDTLIESVAAVIANAARTQIHAPFD
jgi:DNA-binding transcriptional MocR family regulator